MNVSNVKDQLQDPGKIFINIIEFDELSILK